MTEPEKLAAKLLADVPQFECCPQLDLDVMLPSSNAEWLRVKDVLAAIARHFAPGDDLVAQATAALEGVTPGPWLIGNLESYEGDTGIAFRRVYFPTNAEDEVQEAHVRGDNCDANACFIAFARQWVPEAAARLSALTSERDEALAAADDAAEYARNSDAEAATLRDRLARMEGARKTFPLLGGGGVGIDWQLVQEHAGQARTNHGQTLEELGRRGGLSWCELYAVLHDRRWQKMDSNDAMIACRALETRYLAALEAPDAGVVAELVEALRDLLAAHSKPDERICCNGHHCGCQGATTQMMAEHYAKEALALALIPEARA